MANRRYNTQVAQPRGADRVKRAGGGMGGRSGPMMYSRGQGVNMRSKRVPTELMDRGAMKKGGKVIKPKGPGVLRPKPTDRYGQQMKPKPIKPGKKDGGILRGMGKKEKGLTLEKAKKSREKIQMDMFKKKRKEQSDKPKTPLGGKMKKPKPGSSDYQIIQTQPQRPSQILPKKAKGGKVLKPVDKNKNRGLSKLPTQVRNKMGYMKKGGKVKKFGGGKK
jgi:hypothetical protein